MAESHLSPRRRSFDESGLEGGRSDGELGIASLRSMGAGEQFGLAKTRLGAKLYENQCRLPSVDFISGLVWLGESCSFYLLSPR